MITWFTADLHLGHKNIIEYTSRPFKSVEHMDEVLIDNWNRLVMEDDEVYVVGDFTLGGIDSFAKYVSRLNGFIHILPGSHDYHWTRKFHSVAEEYSRVLLHPPMITLEYKGYGDGHYPKSLTLCHYALRTWPKKIYGGAHIYGHSHGKLPPHGLSFDVGVDCWKYYPISLGAVMREMEDLQEEINSKKESQ